VAPKKLPGGLEGAAPIGKNLPAGLRGRQNRVRLAKGALRRAPPWVSPEWGERLIA